VFDVLVRGAQVLTGGRLARVTVAVVGETVAGLLEPSLDVPAGLVVDAHGLVVLPGLVDAHVHLREPGYAWKEGFETGTMAAAAGGVTTVIVMPTDSPLTLTPDDFEAKVRLATGESHVDFALQAGVVGGPDHVERLAELGAVSFELFLGDVPPSLLAGDSGAVLEILRRVEAVGGVAGVTPGDDGIVRAATASLPTEGHIDPRSFAWSRPPIAETLGVARACLLAAEAGARVHLRQVSCRGAVEVLRAARSRGGRLSAEVTPHNLLLTEDELERQGPYAKVAPPLRAAHDLECLWAALKDGTIDMIATDHAPHLPEEKDVGWDDIRRAPGGLPGLQTFLPLMLDQVARGRWWLTDVARTCAEAPARRFGLYPRKGALLPGSDADLVVVDPNRREIIDNAAQWSRARITPFAGWPVTGWPVLTMLRGRVVMREGKIDGSPRGRLVTPRPRSPGSD
jgi:dihydroorotase